MIVGCSNGILPAAEQQGRAAADDDCSAKVSDPVLYVNLTACLFGALEIL